MRPTINRSGDIVSVKVNALTENGFTECLSKTSKCQPALILLCALMGVLSATAQTVTWTGGNTFGSWSNTNNWNPKSLPLNAGGTNYTVIVPDASSLTFDVPSAGAIDALSFGVGSQMLITNGQTLTVNGVAFVKGQIQAKGAGSAFVASANTVTLSSNPQFLATNGATISVGSSTYSWDRAVGSATLLAAVGTNSLVDLDGISSMQLIGNNNPTYYITARSNGLVDLSSLANMSGPGGSGLLQLDIDTGGQIRLDSVRQFNQNVRFNLAIPNYSLPQAVSMDSVTINQTSAGQLVATNLARVANSTLTVSTGGVFTLPALAGVTNTTLNISTGAVFSASQLWSLDNVPLNISGNGSFQATNLVSYINSTIPIQPGRDFESGLLTNIYGSTITVSNGASYRVGASTYEMWPGGYYTYSPMVLLASSGVGSSLDLSSLKTLRVYGVNVAYDTTINNWRGDWTYYITAANQGTIDLSGLETVYGAHPNNYNGADDWLSFKVQSGGTLLLPNLKVVTQRTRFDLLTPQFSLPALQSVENTLFNLQDGGRVDLLSLTNFNKSGVIFGFNSTFNAPQLRTYVNSDLNLVPGQIWTTPAFTNIHWSRFSVSSGTTLAVAAPSYEAPGGVSATVFSANGAGSLLNLGSVGLLRTANGDSGHTYTVAANNNGVINLSGLQSVDAGADAWTFSVQNGGGIQLSNLQQVSGSVAFQMGDGTRLDAPSLTRIAEGTMITFGAGTVFNAPALVEYVNSDLSVSSPGSFISLPLTNIYASRLAVSGGSVLNVAAQQYEIPPFGYYVNPGSPARFAADGAGSLLNLSSLKSIRIYGVNVGWNPLLNSWRGDWDYTANASNQGTIDLSSLQTVYGADPNNYSGSDDWFSFNARLGGKILFGNVSVFQRARFSTVDANSVLDFAGLYLRAPATISLSPGSTLRIRGDFSFENTDAASITADLATLLMDGDAAQQLEVGSRDIGPSPATLQGNFGVGQLVVGKPGQASTLRLGDARNNGGRGAGGEPESLYLFGLGGQGLRLHSGSRLLLGKLNCYATVSGLMVNLRTLIPAGTNSVAFDGGFIADYAGPSITNMTPAVAVTPAVSFVDVTFNIPIQASSFTTADVQITGPGGAVTPASVALVSGTTWRITFPAQTTDGTYTVKVGPNINEASANFIGLDQNGDGLSGSGVGDIFTGSFMIDGSAPQIVQAYALQGGTRVGLTFNEPVTAAFATNPSNYSINGSAPTQAVLLTNKNNMLVSLTVSPVLGESFSVSASNMADSLGNNGNQNVTGNILTLQSVILGTSSDPVEPGSTTPFDSSTFYDLAGGSSIWNAADRGRFIYERRTGDFDVRVRLESLTKVGSSTQAGLMARESTNSNSRNVYVNAEYGTGQNRLIAGYRQTTGGSSAYWPNGSFNTPVAVPDAWMRLKREGDVFRAFSGTNGQDWVEYARLTNALPQTVLAGLASSAVNNSAGQFTTASYREFSDISPYILTQPQSQTVSSGSAVAFGVTVRGLPDLGYQWYFNGIAVGGNTNLLSFGSVTVANAGDYRCVVTNNYGAVTSMLATLVVDGVGMGGFEGDLMPAPNGDNAVTISDWVKIGRLVAGLDSVMNTSEFQRVDSAPRMVGTNVTLGDGRLTVADWTQGGRYAAGLDPLTAAGSPTGLGAILPQSLIMGAASRSLVVSSRTGWQGSQIELPIVLDHAEGDENALGFSVDFDETRLRFVSVTAGKDAAAATFLSNTMKAEEGRLGLALSMPTGSQLGSGSLEIARLRFAVAGDAGSTPVQFTAAPVVCEAVDALANPLAIALINGAVQVERPPSFSSIQLLPSGEVQLLLSGVPGQSCELQTSTDLVNWSKLSSHVLEEVATPVKDATAAGAQSRYYRLAPLQ